MKEDIYKGREGWEARTTFPMPELAGLQEGEPELAIHTSKDSRGMLTSLASVSWAKDGMLTFTVFRDFLKRVIREKVRVTEASVTAQHRRAVAMLDDLKAEAIGFYRMMKEDE